MSEGEVPTYAALSYCWGDDQPMKTTNATLKERESGIPLSKLLKTLQDAIEITRRIKATVSLGRLYLHHSR